MSYLIMGERREQALRNSGKGKSCQTHQDTGLSSSRQFKMVAHSPKEGGPRAGAPVPSPKAKYITTYHRMGLPVMLVYRL